MGDKEKGLRIVRRKTPNEEWNSSHGNKIVHHYWLGAFFELYRIRKIHYLNNRHDDTIKIYSCRWGQWYNRKQTARKHYHVGVPPKEDSSTSS